MTTLLSVKNISVTLGNRKILDNVSLDMEAGGLKVLIGPSGAGKSTLLQCINHLIVPDEGEIYLEGKKINTQNNAELCRLRQNVGMIFQDFNLFDHLTALDNICLALIKVHKLSKTDAQKRARKELERVGLANRADFIPPSFQADKSSVSPLQGRWQCSRKFFCSTNPPPPSTLNLLAKS